MLLHANCSSLDDRVPGDKIDDYVDDEVYDDSTDFKMWQGSLPHKNIQFMKWDNSLFLTNVKTF